MKRKRIVLALLAVWSASSCAAKSPLDRLLHDLEARVEDRNAEAVVELLAPDFKAENGMSRAEVQGELKRYFFAYESLDVSLSEIAPSGAPPTHVSLRVDMEGKVRQVGGLGDLMPGLSAWSFDFDLVTKDGRLLVSAARWTRIDRPQP